MCIRDSRQAMDDYEKKKFVAKAENLTVGQLLDVWAEEELKTQKRLSIPL